MSRDLAEASDITGTAGTYPAARDDAIPDTLLERWQQLLDITATIFDVPAGLIMRIDPPEIEVFQASTNPENPYEVGGREELFGLYCEEVVQSREELHVANAQESDRWRDNLDVREFGLLAYLGYPIEWPDGAVFGTICVLDEEEREFAGVYRDLLQQFRQMVESDLEVLSQQRDLEAQNDRLQKFASIVSHDLRNPLSVAEGYLELAQREHDSEHLTAVERAHRRMEAMIEDLLTLARNDAQQLEPVTVELGAAAEQSWRNVTVHDATLQVAGDRELESDPNRLAQVFENLYRNAIEHGGPAVRVTVGAHEDGFYVEDDGPGIDEAERAYVFQPGYTHVPGGTGFGLAIVADVAAAHGWTVAVTDGADGGARFEFCGVR